MKFLTVARRIEKETPSDRIRYADFLRVLAILVVVVGHWLLVYLTVEDGSIVGERLLAILPWSHLLTWVFQVMPVFFFVGGLANAIGWESARDKDQNLSAWLRKRCRRLLYPVVPLVIFWSFLTPVLVFGGVEVEAVKLASQVALLPIWFLAAYLCVIAISPLAYWLHTRLGLAAIVGFVVLALITDILHRSGVPYVGWGNFLWVWGAIHQAGFFWHDRRIAWKPVLGLGVVAITYVLLYGMTQHLDYPLSMVGTGDRENSNNSPPSFALLLLAFAQLGWIIVWKKPADHLLRRPLIWAAVVVSGQRLMTIYVWHQTAMVLIAGLLLWTGLWEFRAQVDLIWWLQRIPWVFILSAGLAVFVLIFGRFELRGFTPVRLQGNAFSVLLGIALSVFGLATLILQGMVVEDFVLILPLPILGVLFAGFWLSGVVGSSASAK